MLTSCKNSIDAGVRAARDRQQADREQGYAVRSFYFMEKFIRASIYFQSSRSDALSFIKLSVFQGSDESSHDFDFDSPFILSLSPITDLIVFTQKDLFKLILSTARFGVLVVDLSACFNGVDKTCDITEKQIIRKIDCSFSRIFLSPSNTVLAGIEADGYGVSLVDLSDERKPVSSLSTFLEACDTIQWREDSLVFAAYSSFAPSNIYFCQSRNLSCQKLSYPHKDDQILVRERDPIGRLRDLRQRSEDHRELPLEKNGHSGRVRQRGLLGFIDRTELFAETQRPQAGVPRGHRAHDDEQLRPHRPPPGPPAAELPRPDRPGRCW